MTARVPPENVERILVIHTAFLGDIVLATPFLAALRAAAPRAEIHFLTTPASLQLLTPNPWNVVLVPFHKRGKEKGLLGLWQKSRELRKFKPQLVFVLHRSLRSSLLATLVGGESWGFQEAAGAFLLNHKVSRKGIEFEAEKNLALVKAWAGAGEFFPYPFLQESAEDALSAEKILAGTEKFVAIAPSSVWATKRWPAERFGELAKKLWQEKKLRTVVLGSDAPEDQAAAAALVAGFGAGGGAPLNLTGKTSLGVMKSVLARAALVVSNDSSPLHMGIALGRPVVGIFGPTTRELGFFPLAPAGKAEVAEHLGLNCRPCGLHGHHHCPLQHFRCMLELNVDQVYAKVERLCPP